MAILEIIPDYLLVKKVITDAEGNVTIKEVRKNVKIVNLARPVSFESKYRGVALFLVSARQRPNSTGGYEPIPNTTLRVKFKGYKLEVNNSRILEYILNYKAYKMGKIYPDPEDPSGFWRQAGIIEVETVQVLKGKTVRQPTMEDIKLKKITDQEKDEVPVEALRKLV